MNIFLLIGLLSTQGFGYSNQHTVIGAAEFRAHGFSVYADFAPTHKLDAQDGYSFVVRPSYRIGGGFYVMPGFEISHQHTTQYSKNGYFAVARAGYNSNHGWDAYSVSYIPLNGNARYAFAGGLDMDTYRGLVGRVEVTFGPQVSDGINTSRQVRSVVLLGWSWK